MYVVFLMIPTMLDREVRGGRGLSLIVFLPQQPLKVRPKIRSKLRYRYDVSSNPSFDTGTTQVAIASNKKF